MKIIRAGLTAANPDNFILKFINKNRLVCNGRSYFVSKYDKIWLVAMGKAAYAMAKSFHKIVPANGGIIVIPQNYVLDNNKFQVIHAGHPIPNKNSVLAAKKIIALLQKTGKNDLVVFLISGGSSALVCLPDGITLGQKIKTTQILLESGATISEINTIRKHLSAIKGGKLLSNLHCKAISYVMSDVVNNDLGSIGSGIAYCDKTTFSDCLGIIAKYGLAKKIPKSVLERLRQGARGKIAETPKKAIIPNQIIATNSDCLDAMLKTAKQLGYKPSLYSGLTGDVESAAQKILKKFQNSKSCLVFGGETTVCVKGKGRGGRNQELVLHVMSKSQKNITVASVGTDGIDGNTKYAGAIFDHVVPLDVAKLYLQSNNSNSFFTKHGGLIRTGPTHTNLLDIGVVLKHF
jgi:hydroxypyruvate reductase